MQKVVLFISYFIILMATVGCERPVEAASPPTPWTSTYLSIKPECPSRDQCQFAITIGPFEEYRNLNLTLRANHGIKFRDDLLLYEDIIVSDAKRLATITDLHLQPEGTRTIYVPFSIKSERELTGEYIVDVELESIDEADRIVNQLQIRAFIQNDNDGGDGSGGRGRPELLLSQSAFNEKYPFTGDGTLLPFIQLDEDDHPRQGILYVKLIAPHANYHPNITLHSDGGIEIQEFTPLDFMADTGGSRVVGFQFRIVEGKHPRDGRYVFSISVNEENDIPIHQTLSVAVELISEPNTHRQQWLRVVDSVTIASTSENSAAIHLETTGAYGGQGSDTEPSYSDTVSTEGHSASTSEEAQQSAIPDTTSETNESNSEATPPAGRGGGSPIPSHADNEPSTPSIYLVEEHHNDPRCQNWKYTISSGIDLTLMDTYHKYVAEKVTEMSKNHFVVAFRLCNNIGTQVGEVTLHAGKTYYLPDGSHP